jgi:hypothetical protein
MQCCFVYSLIITINNSFMNVLLLCTFLKALNLSYKGSFVIDSFFIYADFLYDHLTFDRLPFYAEHCSDNAQKIGDFLKYSKSKMSAIDSLGNKDSKQLLDLLFLIWVNQIFNALPCLLQRKTSAFHPILNTWFRHSCFTF